MTIAEAVARTVPGEGRFSPPSQPGVVHRDRISAALESAVGAGRVTVLAAPSGFGKSVATADWARGTGMPVAWLSLTRYDSDPRRLLGGVLGALRRLALSVDDPALQPLLLLDATTMDLVRGYDALCDVLGQIESPVALVIDDVHRAGESLRHGIVASLVEQAPETLRLVLVGREPRQLPWDRLLLSGEAAQIPADDLQFDTAETVAAASALGRSITEAEARRIVTGTSGWSAAVRLALVSGPAATAKGLAGGMPQLTEFIADEVLGSLPDDVADFVLATTTVSDLDEPLAVALSGRSDAGALLEECLRRGLFLDRFGEAGHGAQYRWHSVFAQRCRAILSQRDAERARRLHLAAAAELVRTDPLRAVDEYLVGGDDRMAVATLRAAWVGLLVGPNGGALQRLCSALPEPHANDPEIAFIRACAVDMAGDRSAGQRLYRNTVARLQRMPQDERERLAPTRDLAGLFLCDERAELAELIERVSARLDADTGDDPQRAAASRLMLGTTRMIIRDDPDRTLAALEAAQRWGTVAGDPVIVGRTLGMRAFTHAFRGDFNVARGILQGAGGDDATDAWHSYLGGAENFAAGFVAYYSGDLGDARVQFHRVIEGGSGPTSFTGVARLYLGYIAALAGDHRERLAVLDLLREMPDVEIHGIPWPAYRLIATAKIAEAEGNRERAAAIVRRFNHVEYIPAATVELAEVARRCVSDSAAVALLEQLRVTGRAPYVRAGSLVTMALVSRSAGDYPQAHQRLERALEIAEPEGIGRPFVDDVPELRDLLAEHGSWGTRHAEFIARLGSPREEESGLSEREREVLGYLRTDRTAAEIAEALGVSINTVKTHLRAVYRKLGVSSRREAVRSIA